MRMQGAVRLLTGTGINGNGPRSQRAPKDHYGRGSRHSQCFTIAIYEKDLMRARELMNATIGYDTRKGIVPVDVLNIDVFDPSRGAKAGQLFAIVELSHSAPASVFKPYFGDACVVKCSAFDKFYWKRFFTQIDI